MNSIYTIATPSTPEIKFDPASGIFNISGRSTSINPVEFYNNLARTISDSLDWLPKNTTFRFYLDYFNSTSNKSIYQLLKFLLQCNAEGMSFKIIWVVEDKDEFMAEAGETFASMLETVIEFEQV